MHEYAPRNLHNWSTDEARKFYVLWKRSIPNITCNCQQDFNVIEHEFPPVFDSPEGFFERSWQWHNAVNAKLTRPCISLEEAKLLWFHDYLPDTENRKRVVVTVATGAQFQQILQYTEPTLRYYAAKCGADFVKLTNVTQDWWGLEKFRVRRFAEAYDRCLFVDADILIHEDTPDLFDVVPDTHVAMHDDWPYQKSLKWLHMEREQVFQSQGLEAIHTTTCYNSGFVMVSKRHADVWTPPSRRPFPTSHCAEQIWVEYNASKYPMLDLDLRWNTQWWMHDIFWKEIENAHIIHLANCPNRLELLPKLVRPRAGNRHLSGKFTDS